jgi:hypothetical protein
MFNIKKWLYNWLNSVNDNRKMARLESVEQPLVSSSRIESRGMNFSVYRANGGYVIEHRVYDRKTDRSDNSLHIITDEKDLGEEIAKIITFENIRN